MPFFSMVRKAYSAVRLRQMQKKGHKCCQSTHITLKSPGSIPRPNHCLIRPAVPSGFRVFSVFRGSSTLTFRRKGASHDSAISTQSVDRQITRITHLPRSSRAKARPGSSPRPPLQRPRPRLILRCFSGNLSRALRDWRSQTLPLSPPPLLLPFCAKTQHPITPSPRSFPSDNF